jgi:hypothetical protein
MLEGQFEVEVKQEFREIHKTVERTGLGIHDHIDHMESGQLSKLMTAVMDMTERVRKMEKALEKSEAQLLDLGVEISNLQKAIEIATKGR